MLKHMHMHIDTVSIAHSLNLVRKVMLIGHMHIPKGLRAARLGRRLMDRREGHPLSLRGYVRR